MRAGAARRWSGRGDPARRCDLVCTGREALARRGANDGDDAFRNSGKVEWENRRLDGEGQRRAVSKLIQLGFRGIPGLRSETSTPRTKTCSWGPRTWAPSRNYSLVGFRAIPGLRIETWGTQHLPHLQLTEVRNAGLHQWQVHLHEVIFDAGCLGSGKDSFPIERVLAYGHDLASL